MYNPQDKELNDKANRLIENEILCCDSSLVDALLKAEFDGFGIDDIEGLYVDPSDWDIEECKDYLSDEGYSGDLPEDPEDEDEWQDCVRSISEDPKEVFEWWRVSRWLYGELRAQGEPGIDNDYGYWWGRCTTGQSIIADGIMQRIVNRLEAASK